VRAPAHAAGLVDVAVTTSAGTGTLARGFTYTSYTVAPCVATSTSLCLNGGRFRAEAQWRVPTANQSGQAAAIPLTGDTGYFWFFSSNNVELVVKVVDGRAFNGRFWFFSGALSDVEYTITVTDTHNGAVRTYTNPQGTLASSADTAAFLPATVLPESKAEAPDLPPASSAAPVAPVSSPATSACTGTTTSLCLNASRFRVSVDWQVPVQGTSGSGFAVPLTSDTGYFWFFSSNNVELVVKVVDGRAFNGRFWVFSGALSNVAYTIRVTDTQTGSVRTYVNPSGRLSSFADVSAF
jgi:hypothetical protein